MIEASVPFRGAKAPYGYQKDSNHLIVDADAATVVRYIFDLALQGRSCHAIAQQLMSEGVMIPSAYSKSAGTSVTSERKEKCRWNRMSVRMILTNEVYKGDTVGCKRKTDGETCKRQKRPKSEWTISKDTHAAIISEEDWEAVQALIVPRRRASASRQLFAGRLYCADCGAALSFSKIPRKTMEDTGKYRCWNALEYGSDICTPHYIRQDKLIAVLADDLQKQVEDECGSIEAMRDYLQREVIKAGVVCDPDVLTGIIQKRLDFSHLDARALAVLVDKINVDERIFDGEESAVQNIAVFYPFEKPGMV